MQTKVTAVSPPSLLFSLGQLIGRTKKRERKIHEKQQTLFSSLPGNSLKFFFIKEKIDIYIYVHVFTQCKEGWTNGNKSQIRQRSPGLLFHQFMSLSKSSQNSLHSPSHCFNAINAIFFSPVHTPSY